MKASVSSGEIDTILIEDDLSKPLKTCTGVTGECATQVAAGTGVGVVLFNPTAFDYTCPGATSVAATWDDSSNGYVGYCSTDWLAGDFTVTVP